ncbi:MAG: rhomboid family intramembrane serine protease [Proteobacteria bacterium]|nr:rhomboid family intramembrane serine protease [Pseudomonadota bacterium]MCP4919290.1 rhomboid family intramembrane serine protease [Pseudomonadota bacterium]
MDGPIKFVDRYGDIVSVRKEWLDEEIRSGHFSPFTGVQYEPWTGEAFLPIGELPAFAEVWKEPNAAFTKHLLRKSPAWLSHVVSGSIFLAGLAQLSVFFGWAPTFIALFFELGATGFEPILLDDRVLAPWTSQLIHGTPDHLLMNLAVLGYCGYRVERAMGWAGYLAVAVAGVLGGSLGVTCFEDLPVIGSSILAFAVWGAQIAIGFRYGHSIVPKQRRFYGYGNLLAFAVLFVGTLRSDAISHYGHLGGLVGGVAVAMTLRPRFHGGRPFPLIVAVTLVTLAIGPLIRLVPPLAWGVEEPVVADQSALILTVPGRLVPEGGGYEYTIMGEPAWKTSWASDEAIYTGLLRQAERSLQAGDLLLGQDFVDYLDDRYDIQGTLVEEPQPIGPGWTVTSVEFVDAVNGRTYRIDEHHLARGRYLTRLGHIVEVDAEGPANRRGELFARIVADAVEDELPSVAHARSEVARSPTSRRLRLELADALSEAGGPEEADGLYAELVSDTENYGGDATTNRIWMWGHQPAAFETDDTPWFVEWVDAYPDDRTLQLNAVRWYAHHGRCEAGLALETRLFERRPELESTLAEMRSALDEAQCGVRRGESSDGDAEG